MRIWRGVVSRPSVRDPLVLLAITILFFWKLTLTGQFTWGNHPDMGNQVLPWYQFQAQEWHRGQFPLWDPYLWGGQSLIGQDLPGAACPVNWILFSLPLKHGEINHQFLNYYWVLLHYLAVLFAYYLCRDFVRSSLACMLGGMVFGFGGYVGIVEWPVMLNGALWAPLVLLFFLRAMRGQNAVLNSGLSGAFLGISLLGGHHQIPLFVAVAIGACWLYYWLSGSLSFTRLLQLGSVFALFVFLLSALQILPALEYWKLSLRWVGVSTGMRWNDKVPYVVHSAGSINPVSLLGILIARIRVNADPFLGFAIVSLAVMGAMLNWKRREVRLLAGLAAGGVVFSLGARSVFHGALYSIFSAIAKARTPAMAIVIFQLACAVLAALGLDALTNWSAAKQTVQRVAYVLWGCCLLFYTLLVASSVFEGDRVFGHEALAIAALAVLLLGIVFTAYSRGGLTSRSAAVSLVLIALLELGNVTTFNYTPRQSGWTFLEPLQQDRDILEFLRARTDFNRVSIDPNAISFNFGDWHAIDEISGYAGLTENVFTVFQHYNGHLLLGENYYVGKQPLHPEFAEVFTARSGLKIYHNPLAFPRAWTVHEVVSIANRSEIHARLDQPLDTLHREAFVSGEAPKLERCDRPDTVSVVEKSTNRMALQASMACRGMVILADSYFPGWVATIDGRDAPIYETYGTLRGVVAEAGEHRIEMRYRPRSVYLGATCTLLGFVCVAGFLVVIRRREETHSTDVIPPSAT